MDTVSKGDRKMCQVNLSLASKRWVRVGTAGREKSLEQDPTEQAGTLLQVRNESRGGPMGKEDSDQSEHCRSCDGFCS